MLAEIGFFTTIFAGIAAIYAIISALYGVRMNTPAAVVSARNAVVVSCIMLVLAAVALQIAIVNQEYQMAYVWSVSNPSMPTFYRVTALWGSQQGSLLFWSALMSVFAALAVTLNWRSNRRLMPYVIATLMSVLIFFIGLNLFVENPFERWWLDSASVNAEVLSTVLQPAGAVAPSEARLAESAQGLSPMLRHFGMAIHPPMLYLGFVGFLVPFAFAIAAMASGDLSTNWIKASRRWVLVAWLFLTLGLILGGRWAYDVLGWGGYWGWDPVENAAFLPWLVGTALLHSIMIQQKRGMLKTWNLFLVILTFSSVIFGTFATRSGLVESVHSFARSGIGTPMFLFWFTLTFTAVALLLWRRSQGLLRDERQFKSFLSRESLFVLNNLIFVALFFVVAWGSFGAPITSELFMDTNITLGTDYFMRVTPPLFLAMYILMGVAPLSAWGATSLAKLGKSLAMPLVLTAITMTFLFVTGTNSIGAMIGYGVVFLSGYVAIVEIGRGFLARQRVHKESPIKSFTALFARNPRRYGGYMIHLGVTIIGIGLIGSTMYQMETQQTLGVGDSLFISDYEIRYDSIEGAQISTDGRIMDIANVTVLRNGEVIDQMRPRRDFYTSGETMTIAGTHSTLENDVYVLLVGWEEISQNSATFKVYINPLVNLIWWGSFILILGTIIAVWPRDVVPSRVRDSVHNVMPRGVSHA